MWGGFPAEPDDLTTSVLDYLAEHADEQQVTVTEDNDILRLSNGVIEMELTEYQAFVASGLLIDARNDLLDRWNQEATE